ncbi:hypothetical protein GCM10022240_29630 [Microbacterium kribbense]|uniref:Uncharacterized protein n=1 Tax=Microbacterium kribbense TaxID=433645 RepID=A0ABP7GXB8_9MICO
MWITRPIAVVEPGATRAVHEMPKLIHSTRSVSVGSLGDMLDEPRILPDVAMLAALTIPTLYSSIDAK